MKCKNKNCKNHASYSCNGYCAKCYVDKIKQLNLNKFEKLEEEKC